jgi:hypothetical protein
VNESILQQLIRPEAFKHPAGDLVLRETHISWVILSGDYAYKIKKPVNFGFLDFSTLALRHHFCQQELDLNRRFAPELYLSVIPITETSAGPVFDGRGPVIDYAVKMRRFNESSLLDNIATRGELNSALVRQLARELARLHGELPPVHPDPHSALPGTPAALLAAIEQNFQQVRDYPLASRDLRHLEAVEHWTRQRYTNLLPLMKERVAGGKVIDGHGDAHLGNIALIKGVVTLFDCIEFSPELRMIDSIGEIGLLSMDLEARGHPRESHLVLTDYLEYRGDYEGLTLIDLYRCYYAMVRAKVNLLREPPDKPGLSATKAYREMSRYLELAYRYGQPTQPFFAITHGVSGSGKSTVAAKLVAESGAIRIRSDVERKRLYGLAPEQRSRPEDETRLYSKDMTRRTFERLKQAAQLAVEAGFSVIIDATFLHRRVRDDFRALADQLQVHFAIIDCVAEHGHMHERLIERERQGQDASEADVRVMERQLEQREALSGDESAFRVEAGSHEDPELLWKRLKTVLD